MAKSDEPINHDGASTVATVGSKVVKWGIIGGAIALALPPVILIGGGYAAIALASAGTVPGIMGAIAVGALSIAGAVSTWGLGGAAAVGGGALGFFKGADQVSKESSAFRAKVTARMNNVENKEAKTFNDGENKGLEEGYALAVQDLKPQLEAARNEGREEGAKAVVEQIQQHMQAEMAAAQKQQAPVAEAQHHGKQQHRVDGGHDKSEAAPHAKPPVHIGGKVIASCECPDGSKAAAIAEQKVQANEAGHTLTT